MRPLDLVGMTFGKWVVLEKIPSVNGHTIFLCLCQCGNKKEQEGNNLTRKRRPSRSCGCNRTIGTTKEYREHPLYDVWKGMKARCRDKKHISYKNYGGRGVTVCEEWQKDFFAFYNWAISSGYKEGLKLDKDIKGNGLLYSPDTCLWVSNKDNVRASRIAKLCCEKAKEIRASSETPKNLAIKYNVSTSSIHQVKSNKTWVQ